MTRTRQKQRVTKPGDPGGVHYAIFHGCKNDNFQMKNCDIYSYFCSKHRSWVHVRIASVKRFLRVSTIYVLEQKQRFMHQSFVAPATLGPRNSGALNFSIFKALLKALHCRAKFVVKSPLKAPAPGGCQY